MPDMTSAYIEPGKPEATTDVTSRRHDWRQGDKPTKHFLQSLAQTRRNECNEVLWRKIRTVNFSMFYFWSQLPNQPTGRTDPCESTSKGTSPHRTCKLLISLYFFTDCKFLHMYHINWVFEKINFPTTMVFVDDRNWDESGKVTVTKIN